MNGLSELTRTARGLFFSLTNSRKDFKLPVVPALSLEFKGLLLRLGLNNRVVV